MFVWEGGHELFPFPRHYPQIVSLSVPPLGVQRDEYQEPGLDYRPVGHFPLLRWKVVIIWTSGNVV